MIIVAPTLDQLFEKVVPFIKLIVPTGTPVLRAPLNRVAQPKVDHVLVTAWFNQRLRTNVESYDDPADQSTPGTRLAEMGTEVRIQCDFYGSLAAGWAQAFETLWRDPYGCEALAPTCQPLYADDARMIPRVTGEEQFLERWIVDAVAQYNPVAIMPQEFADQLNVTLVEVDTEFPPS